MKQWFALLSVSILTAALSFATTVPCSGVSVPLTVASGSSSSSASFSCMGLTFDMFSLMPASNNFGSTTPSVVLGNATNDGSTVFLDFNPNMANNSSVGMDLWFFFRVTGPVDMLDLFVGGNTNNPSQILEKACDQPFDGNGFCHGNVTASVDAFTGANGQLTFSNNFGLGSGGIRTLYIFKDIQVPAGTGLTFFEQSFHTGAAVPEPVSMMLLGSGLVALGFLKRRSRKS